MSLSHLFSPLEGINFNAGTIACTPLAVMDRIEHYQRELERNPPGGWLQVWGRIWEAQKCLAAYFHARPQDMFLRPNVTAACNDFILGVDLPAGNLVTTNLEYGAVINIQRLRCAREGRELRTIQLPTKPQSPQEILNVIEQALRPQDRLLLISHITTGTGVVMPIKDIAKLTRSRGIVLVVDGAHGPGFSKLDFRELSDVDFYGGNLHKWMMGPKGSGFGWVPEWRQASVQNIQAGWTTFETVPYFDQFVAGSDFARRMLMAYTFNFASFLALVDLVEFWQKVGEATIQRRRDELRDYLDQLIQAELGFPRVHAEHPELRGPLLAYTLPEKFQSDAEYAIPQLARDSGVWANLPAVDGVKRLRLSVGPWMEESVIREGVKRLQAVLRP